MPPQINWLQLFPSLEDPPRKALRTQAALAYLSIYQQIGNLNFAWRWRPFGDGGRLSHRLELDQENRGRRPRLTARKRASSCRLWKSRESGLTGLSASLSF